MLAAAVALHEGFRYHPDGDLFWKQSVGNENSYLFVTTRHLNSPYLDSIKDTMEEGEYLIIACRSFDSGLDKAYDNITVKKIPQMLLERCEFGKADYNLNIVHPPVYDDCDEEEEGCLTIFRSIPQTISVASCPSAKPQTQSLKILEEITNAV